MATFISLRSPMPSGLYGCLSLSLILHKKEKCCNTYDNILQYKNCIFSGRRRPVRLIPVIEKRVISNNIFGSYSYNIVQAIATLSIYRHIDTTLISIDIIIHSKVYVDHSGLTVTMRTASPRPKS